MPKIRQYTSSTAERGLQPSDLGIRATEEAARAIGQAGRSLGQSAEDIAEPLETSSLSTEYALTTAQLSQKTNEFFKSADPNDPDLFNKYRESVLDPALENFGSGPHLTSKSQDLAQAYRKEMETHYLQTALGDQSTMAGAAIEGNLTHSLNALSQGVLADPTQHDHFQAAWNDVVEAQIRSHPGITAEQAAKIREDVGLKGGKEIAASTARSMAEKNPAEAIQDLDSGMFNKYLNGEEISKLKGYANTQQRASDANARAEAAAVKQREKENFDSASNQVVAAMIQPDGSLRVPPGAPKVVAGMLLMPGAEPGAGRALANMLDSVAHQDSAPITDGTLYGSFMDRAFLPDSDPRKLSATDVLKARGGRALSDKDFSFFMRVTQEKDPKAAQQNKQMAEYQHSFKRYFTQSNPLTGKFDPRGDQRYAEWLADSRAVHDQMIQGGKSEQDARAAMVSLVPRYQIQIDVREEGKNFGKTPVPLAPMHLPTIGGDADFAKLPKGAQFVGPDGKLYRKK